MKNYVVDGHEDSLLPADAEWRLVWADEFDGKKGGKPDPDKWLYRTKFWGYNSKTYIKEEGVELDGKGNLLFKLVAKDGNYYSTQLQTGSNAFDYMVINGRNAISTFGERPFWPLEKLPKPTFMHRFGYYEVRCKLQKQPGWWSAFWLQSPSIGTTIDGKYSGIECDILECFDGPTKKVTSGLFLGGYAAECQRVARVEYFPENTSHDAFHRFGVEWNEDGYIFYCDGKKTATTTEVSSHVEQFILLSTECQGYRVGNLDKPSDELKQTVLPDEFVVDYVRVFDKI
ncbi:MAG: glycoside hydrolase family 16 protein [Clostridiales bacterium]|jgi:hypothetical protein|nr:glycoside hydrolase family 16 protein [Clostridiales bacterium]